MENSHTIIGMDYLVEMGMVGQKKDVMFLAKDIGDNNGRSKIRARPLG